MDKTIKSSLFERIENEITNYTTKTVEISKGVVFSQYQTINRIYKFKNKDLSGSKLNADLSYNYYFDIISPRADSEVKNLRFDTKNIVTFSRNPRKDFPVVFISNASLKSWMAENGEDDKLKAAVEEFTANGNIIFKRVKGGYDTTDALNTYITNQQAKTIDDTDIIERHEMTASQMKGMSVWDQSEVDKTIENCGNKTFSSTSETTPSDTTSKRYEIFEFTGEVSEKEYNEILGVEEEGDSNNYFLAKVICSGLRSSGTSEKYVLFADKLDGKMSNYYIDAHRGKYEGRFWRVGMYELLFDHQIRANEIGNQLSTGLEWASKVIFRSKDSKVLQNIRADMDNGDVVITEDLAQINLRMSGLDQLIADWNRINQDADRLSGSSEVVRGESSPSGTPFRLGALQDANAGKMFALIRQKITLPYKRVFREWVLPELIKDLSGEDVFRLIGDSEVLDQLREIMAETWYMDNLVKIGFHTKEIAESIKAEKMDELRRVDPVIVNSKEIWKGVMPRLFITITGENSDMADNITDLTQLLNMEQDPERIAFLLDSIYKIRGIPVPPKKEEAPAESQLEERGVEPKKTESKDKKSSKVVRRDQNVGY
jgi:hypothetical protein